MRRAPLLTLAAVLVACALALVFGPGTDPHGLTERGYAALGRGDHGGAADDFRTALERLAPDDPDAERATVGLVRALAHFEPGQARDRFLAFADDHPDAVPAEVYKSVAREVFQAGAKVEAIHLLDAGIVRFGERADLLELMDGFKEDARRADDPEALEALAGLGYAG